MKRNCPLRIKLSSMNRLGYPSSLVNCIIDNCDYSSTLDVKTKSDETLRVSIPFKDQVPANIVKRQMRDLSSKIGIDVQPIYTSKKLGQDLKLQEIKPRIINQHSVVYCFKCDLCDSNYVGYTTRHLFQRVADHRYSAIGRHLRDAHGNIDSLNESQFRTLKKCSTKWDCLVYEMLYIRTIGPNLNTHYGQSLCLTFNASFNLFIFLLYTVCTRFHYLLSLDNDVLETLKRRAMFYNILSQNFIVKHCFTNTNYVWWRKDKSEQCILGGKS